MFKTKVCSKCKVEKDEMEFYRRRRSNRLSAECKDCEREHRRNTWGRNKALNADVDVYDGTDRRCPKCKKVYPKEKRYWKKNRGHLSGLQSLCRMCGTRISLGYKDTGDLALDIVSRVIRKWICERSYKRNKRENVAPWVEHCEADFFNMIVQQQGRCAVSNVPLTPDNVSIDHIVPVIKGGTHELSNLRLVAWDVNRAMSSLDDDDFIELCRQVINHQLDLLIYGDKKTSEANLPTEAECISLDADPDLG